MLKIVAVSKILVFCRYKVPFKMQSLDVCRKTSGKVWHRKPTPSSDNGYDVNNKTLLFKHIFPAGRAESDLFS